MQQAEKIKNKNVKAIESVETLNDKLQAELCEISIILGFLDKFKQNQQLFISANKALTDVKEYTDETRKYQKITLSVDMHFHAMEIYKAH